MKSKIKKIWIEALESGHYKQICGIMRKQEETLCKISGEYLPDMNPKNNNMCVMGVLADLALKDSNLKPTPANWFKFADLNEVPSERTLRWAGLDNDDASKMIDDNDGMKKVTFKEFAEYIKENF